MAALTPYKDKLSGKSILIIGGTSGIGLGVASLCLAHNAIVTISSSTDKKLTNALDRLKAAYPNASVTGYTCDLRANAVEQSTKALFEKTGKLDHIVHTAGDPLATCKLSDVTVEQIQKAGEIRFVSALIIAKHAQEYLKGGPESSLTLTSGAVADRPHANWSVVASYAGGLYSMTKNLALDMKPLRVNLVSPGAVNTELWDGMSAEAKQKLFEGIKSRVLTQAVGQPEDVAEAYLYSMRDRNITGEIIKTNSGLTLV
jgi:NAD(P)-dependent dehydrogenase (short-subunit alcohol dehydrogenase family)